MALAVHYFDVLTSQNITVFGAPILTDIGSLTDKEIAARKMLFLCIMIFQFAGFVGLGTAVLYVRQSLHQQRKAPDPQTLEISARSRTVTPDAEPLLPTSASEAPTRSCWTAGCIARAAVCVYGLTCVTITFACFLAGQVSLRRGLPWEAWCLWEMLLLSWLLLQTVLLPNPTEFKVTLVVEKAAFAVLPVLSEPLDFMKDIQAGFIFLQAYVELSGVPSFVALAVCIANFAVLLFSQLCGIPGSEDGEYELVAAHCSILAAEPAAVPLRFRIAKERNPEKPDPVQPPVSRLVHLWHEVFKNLANPGKQRISLFEDFPQAVLALIGAFAIGFTPVLLLSLVISIFKILLSNWLFATARSNALPLLLDRLEVALEARASSAAAAGRADALAALIRKCNLDEVQGLADLRGSWQSAAELALQRTLSGVGGSVGIVVLDRRARRLFSGSEDKTIREWDLDKGTEVRRFEGHTGSVLTLVLDSGARRLYSGSEDKTIREWDLDKGTEVRRFEGHADWVRTLVLDSGARRLYSGSGDMTIREWDLDKGTEVRRFEGHADWVITLVLDSGARRLYSGSEDKTIREWDLDKGTEVRRFEGHTYRVRTLVLDSGARRLYSGSDDRTIREWDLDKGTEVRRFEGHADWVLTLVLDSGARRLYSGSGDKTIREWDLDKGTEVRRFEGHAESVMTLVLDSGARRLYSGSVDKTIREWDLGSGTEVTSWALPRATPPGTLVFDNVSSVLLGGSDNGVVEVQVSSARVFQFNRMLHGAVARAEALKLRLAERLPQCTTACWQSAPAQPEVEAAAETEMT